MSERVTNEENVPYLRDPERVWNMVNMAPNIMIQAADYIEELEANRCDECGAKVYSGPPDCPMCGAPNCCQQCCKIDSQATRIADLEADFKDMTDFRDHERKRIAELEAENNELKSGGIAELMKDYAELKAKLKRVLAEVEEWHLNDKNPWDTLTAIKDIMEELILQSHEAIK